MLYHQGIIYILNKSILCSMERAPSSGNCVLHRIKWDMDPAATFLQYNTSVRWNNRSLMPQMDQSRGRVRTGAVYKHRTSYIWVKSLDSNIIRLQCSTLGIIKCRLCTVLPIEMANRARSVICSCSVCLCAAPLPVNWMWQTSLFARRSHHLFPLASLSAASLFLGCCGLSHGKTTGKWAVLRREACFFLFFNCFPSDATFLQFVTASFPANLVIGFIDSRALSSAIFVWVKPSLVIAFISPTSPPEFILLSCRMAWEMRWAGARSRENMKTYHNRPTLLERKQEAWLALKSGPTVAAFWQLRALSSWSWWDDLLGACLYLILCKFFSKFDGTRRM